MRAPPRCGTMTASFTLPDRAHNHEFVTVIRSSKYAQVSAEFPIRRASGFTTTHALGLCPAAAALWGREVLPAGAEVKKAFVDTNLASATAPQVWGIEPSPVGRSFGVQTYAAKTAVLSPKIFDLRTAAGHPAAGLRY
jgi:hypothetical protein